MLCGLLRVGTTFTADQLSAWCVRRRPKRHLEPSGARGRVASPLVARTWRATGHNFGGRAPPRSVVALRSLAAGLASFPRRRSSGDERAFAHAARRSRVPSSEIAPHRLTEEMHKR